MELAEQLRSFEEQLEKRYVTKNKVRLDKSQSQRIHARTRAMERYELKLNRDEMMDIKRLIWGGRAICIEKQSLRISIFFVRYKGKAMRVVYDKKRKNLVSFLPLEPKKEQDAQTG